MTNCRESRGLVPAATLEQEAKIEWPVKDWRNGCVSTGIWAAFSPSA